MRSSGTTLRFFIAALLLVGGTFSIFGWLAWSVVQTEGEIATLVGEIDSRTLEEDRLHSIEAILETTEVERAALNSRFISDDTVVPFIEEIEALGVDADVLVTITSVDTEAAIEEGTEDTAIDAYQFLRIRLSVRGAWDNVFHFTTLLDALPAAIDVSDAIFARATVEADSEWRGSFTMRIGMLR